MTILGSNIVTDAGFDNEAEWVVTQDGDAIVTFGGSILHMENGGASGLAQVVDDIEISEDGAWYELKLKGLITNGPLRVRYGGVDTNITDSGITTVRFQAVAAGTALQIKRIAPNFDVDLDWISIRKEGQKMSSLVMEFRDFDGDKKQFSIEMGAVTTDVSYGIVSGEAAALATAIAAVCAGNVSNQQFIATETEPDDTDATDFLAQTHVRWIIEWKDATTGDGPYQTAIPTPDLGDNTLVLVGSNHYDPANAEWITLIAAMEGGEVKNPRTGNNIIVQDIFLEE